MGTSFWILCLLFSAIVVNYALCELEAETTSNRENHRKRDLSQFLKPLLLQG